MNVKLYEGYQKTEPGGWEIVVNHRIKGVSPAMITWWDHIDTTERYRVVASDRSCLL